MSPFSALLAAATLAAAGNTGDAVLVQFSSQSCAPCRAMQPTVSRLVSDGYPVQKLDVDKHPEAARQFKIRGVPTFVLLVGNQEVTRVEGPASYERLAGLFDEARPQTVQVAAPLPTPAPQEQAAVRQTTLAPTDHRGGSPEQMALAASVRLRVEDAKGFGFGTGTIIDTHDDEALVVTCGHLFRESQGKGRIGVELFAPGASQPVEGHLIGYDLDRDIALVSIRPGIPVQAVPVAPPGFAVRKADRAFTVGCDKGADATVRQSQITAVNRFLGKPNFSAAGAPIDGRSGGGLFAADGQLIGVCNAADHASDEGLYAGLASIHWQLDQIGQSEIYQRGARSQLAAAAPPASGGAVSIPELPPAMPGGFASAENPNIPVTPASYTPPATTPPGASPAPIADGDTELVVIVRSRRSPGERSEIYLVDQASGDLLSGIVTAARQGAAARAASLAARQPAAAASGASPQLYRAPPVIRAQSGD